MHGGVRGGTRRGKMIKIYLLTSSTLHLKDTFFVSGILLERIDKGSLNREDSPLTMSGGGRTTGWKGCVDDRLVAFGYRRTVGRKIEGCHDVARSIGSGKYNS